MILSDYGKGGLTHIVKMIRLARAAGKPVLVDPKGDDYSRYRGATLITPNRAEFREVAGSWKSEAELTRKANELLRTPAHRRAAAHAQRGRHDALPPRRAALHVPAQAREVFDVSGAGDTVIAHARRSCSRAARRCDEAVRLANRAAGIVVGKFGTAVVQPGRAVSKRTHVKAEGWTCITS